MKFTWGTGIFLFLVVFLAACAVFIIFASRQQVNLVHKDYYEKGVDYSEQMKVDERSKPFARSFETKSTDKFFVVEVDESLLNKMDSGTIHMHGHTVFSHKTNLTIESRFNVCTDFWGYSPVNYLTLKDFING